MFRGYGFGERVRVSEAPRNRPAHGALEKERRVSGDDCFDVSKEESLGLAG